MSSRRTHSDEAAAARRFERLKMRRNRDAADMTWLLEFFADMLRGIFSRCQLFLVAKDSTCVPADATLLENRSMEDDDDLDGLQAHSSRER
jgi:hypothetical protein